MKTIRALAEQVANDIGVTERALFVGFMVRRFPSEGDYSYIKEWGYRFLGGNPERYMDSKSQAVYKEVKQFIEDTRGL